MQLGNKCVNITGFKVGGDRICKNGEINSSANDLVDKCLEMCGDILICQERSISIFSNDTVRYLYVQISKIAVKTPKLDNNLTQSDIMLNSFATFFEMKVKYL